MKNSVKAHSIKFKGDKKPKWKASKSTVYERDNNHYKFPYTFFICIILIGVFIILGVIK